MENLAKRILTCGIIVHEAYFYIDIEHNQINTKSN